MGCDVNDLVVKVLAKFIKPKISSGKAHERGALRGEVEGEKGS